MEEQQEEEEEPEAAPNRHDIAAIDAVVAPPDPFGSVPQWLQNNK